jgi:hypothetical protein
MEDKIDKLTDRVDNHLQRLSVAEESIVWLKGHVKIATALGVAIILGVLKTLMEPK